MNKTPFRKQLEKDLSKLSSKQKAEVLILSTKSKMRDLTLQKELKELKNKGTGKRK